MKVEDIRKEEYVKEYLRLHDSDVRKVLQRRSAFVGVACPACKGAEGRARFEKSGFHFLECASCATLYVSPRPTPDVLEEFYTHAECFTLYNEKIFPASEAVRRRLIFAPRAARVAELWRRHAVGAPDVLLDVGAGFGTFCEEVRALGLFARVVAVEPSPGLAETCRRKGIEVVQSRVETAPPQSAGVITCFELIEHLFAPDEFLSSCARLLRPGGLLVLTTPNIRGFDLEILGPASENIDAPEHLNYFHPASLSRLLERCGFRVDEVLTPGKLDAELVRLKALSGEVDLAGQPFLKRVLIDDWERAGGPFQEFLASACYSSHLWVVARKAADSGEGR